MLVKGQKIQLELRSLNIRFQDANLSVLCIPLNEKGISEKVIIPQVNDSNYIMFDKNNISLEVKDIPSDINKIEIAIASPSKPSIGVVNVECGNLNDMYNFLGEINNKSDAVLLEVYKKDGKWKLSVEGRYFDNSTSMMKAFGAVIPSVVAKPETVINKPETIIKTETPSTVKTEMPHTPEKVSLSKVTLAKRGDSKTISLDKKDKKIHINLNWDSGIGKNIEKKKGFFASIFGGGNSGGGAVDLDLGCMYTTVDGSKGTIQPLGGNFGQSDYPPFIFLDKDDRSGATTDGENMFIFKPEHIQRVLIFALIYEGTNEFSKVNAKLTIKTESEEILIELDNQEQSSKFCAVAMFENVNGRLSLSKEERYFRGHKDCDEHYKFGFNWVAGKK